MFPLLEVLQFTTAVPGGMVGGSRLGPFFFHPLGDTQPSDLT